MKEQLTPLKDRIRLVQMILGHKYALKITPDGVYGPQTQAAMCEVLPWLRRPEYRNRRTTNFLQHEAVNRGFTLTIDNKYGPATDKVVKAFLFLHEYGMNKERPDTGIGMVKKSFSTSQNKWPVYGTVEFIDVFGQPGENLVLIPAVFPLFTSWNGKEVKQLKVNQAIAPAMSRVLTAIADTYTPEDIKAYGLDIYGGSFALRNKRGADELSIHAWGCGNDWNPAKNAYRMKYEASELSRPELKKYRQIFIDEGAVNLGMLYDFDSMHWQFCRS